MASDTPEPLRQPVNTNNRGAELIQNLVRDPARFNGNELLNEYFAGFPLETLRPLLAGNDPAVRRVAVWIASELGEKGRPLINDVAKLIRNEDRYVRFYASDVLAVCSMAEDIDKYEYVVRLLEDQDDAIRVHAMFLISNANILQLKAAARSFGPASPSNELHKKGLSQLSDRADEETISGMIESVHPLLRKYGAIAAWLHREKMPTLISYAKLSGDPDIRNFFDKRIGKQ